MSAREPGRRRAHKISRLRSLQLNFNPHPTSATELPASTALFGPHEITFTEMYFGALAPAWIRENASGNICKKTTTLLLKWCLWGRSPPYLLPKEDFLLGLRARKCFTLPEHLVSIYLINNVTLIALPFFSFALDIKNFNSQRWMWSPPTTTMQWFS